MSSTKRARLTDLLPTRYSGTTSTDIVGVKEFTRAVAVTADTSTSDLVLFAALGSACAILNIFFVPDVAITSSATEKVVLTFFNAGTAGTGTTDLGSYSTYTADTDEIVGALVQYVKLKVYDPTGDELVVVENSVIRVDIDVTTSSSINLQGVFVVRYVPLID